MKTPISLFPSMASSVKDRQTATHKHSSVATCYQTDWAIDQPK